MSARFTAASSTFLRNTAPPITAIPFTAGFWIYATVADSIPWCLSNIGSTTNTFGVYLDPTPFFRLFVTAATEDDLDISPFALNTWVYVVIRCISATNRRVALLPQTGASAHGQSTVSKAPTGINTLNLGRYEDSGGPVLYFNGFIAEYFLTNTDIQAGGAQLDEGLLRQIAYEGPFSIPTVWSSIVDYQSMQNMPGFGALPEIYYGGRGIQKWDNTGVNAGWRAPLKAPYVRPFQSQKLLMT